MASSSSSLPVTMSWGRDYRVGVGAGFYEYCLFRGDDLIGRKGGFRSSTAAKRAGVKDGQAAAALAFLIEATPLDAETAAMTDAELLAELT